ncbi:hypothetical protein Pla175_28630 [Pirellulimonas nuda]|uniref:Uncharacterized protein n=1 Tax=Pirellulimonas nuda TaxID=2528009 RepID=A0A518DDE3_9BACT|nr:hypothetical protein [Pirellulimonas nuda]QDU89473.1 hypothetical protein Pla175_28630 [Pirellulimonas nuda]
MTIKVQCPCGLRLSAPESAAGKKGKCSKCGRTFIIPIPEPVAAPVEPSSSIGAEAYGLGFTGLDPPELGLPDPEGGHAELGDDFGDLLDEALSEPQPASASLLERTTKPDVAAAKAAKRPSNGRPTAGLANGINLVFWGTLIVVASVFLGILAPFAAPAMIVVALLGGGIGMLLSMAGRIWCLATAGEVGAKGLLLAAVACDLAYISLPFGAAASLSSVVAAIAPRILWIATFILFVLFLRAVGKSISQEHLVNEGSAVIAIAAMCIVLLFGMLVPVLSIFAVLAFLVCILTVTFKYLKLLRFAAECVAYSGRRR